MAELLEVSYDGPPGRIALWDRTFERIRPGDRLFGYLSLSGIFFAVKVGHKEKLVAKKKATKSTSDFAERMAKARAAKKGGKKSSAKPKRKATKK